VFFIAAFFDNMLFRPQSLPAKGYYQPLLLTWQCLSDFHGPIVKDLTVQSAMAVTNRNQCVLQKHMF
jgi:hypothetical protein